MTHCPDALSLEAFVDGELTDAPDVVAHIAQCPTCQAEIARLRQLNALLHEAETSIVAPETLSQRLRAATPRPAPIRRRALIGGLAAAAAGVAFIPAVLRDRPLFLAPAILGDFETGLDAGRAPDFASADFAATRDWYSSKADLMAPDPTRVAGVILHGGRLCWLLERRFLALECAHGQQRCTLYAGDAGNLRLTEQEALPPETSARIAVVSRDRVTAGFWQRGKTVYALAGEPSHDTVLHLAQAIRQQAT